MHAWRKLRIGTNSLHHPSDVDVDVVEFVCSIRPQFGLDVVVDIAQRGRKPRLSPKSALSLDIPQQARARRCRRLRKARSEAYVAFRSTPGQKSYWLNAAANRVPAPMPSPQQTPDLLRYLIVCSRQQSKSLFAIELVMLGYRCRPATWARFARDVAYCLPDIKTVVVAGAVVIHGSADLGIAQDGVHRVNPYACTDISASSSMMQDC